MSGTLRDALVAIKAELDKRSEEGEAHLFLNIPFWQLEELLAAHPAEPTAGIPDEAVEAAAKKRAEHYQSEYDSTHLKWQDFAGEAREILQAAAPLLGPRPLLDQQAVADVIYTAMRAQAGPAIASLVGTEVLGRLMELAQPIPTQEQIAKALHQHDMHDPWDDEACNDKSSGPHTSCKDSYLACADAVLQLFAGGGQ